MTDVMVPALGESVSEATVSTWFKKPGDAVKQDEMLCELETDKVSVEVPSPVAGVWPKSLRRRHDRGRQRPPCHRDRRRRRRGPRAQGRSPGSRPGPCAQGRKGRRRRPGREEGHGRGPA